MREFPTAQLALAISILVALWNFVKHMLEGGRVRVTLTPGLHDEYGLATHKTWQALGDAAARRGGWNTEVAVVKVENKGRTAVTISNMQLVFRPGPWWRRTTTYRVGPAGREAPNALTVRTHRLEPFDSATFVYDFWPFLQSSRGGFEPPPRPLTVRVSVDVAGKLRPRSSPWRTRWRVSEGQVAFVPALAEIGMMTYRSMSRHTCGDPHLVSACIPTAIEVRKRFPTSGPAPTREDLTGIIERRYFGDSKVSMAPLVAHDVHSDLVPLYRSSSES